MKAIWVVVVGASLLGVGCAAPESLEGKHRLTTKDEAPVASITTASSSAMEQVYGISRWKIYRSKNDIHMTGYDKHGTAVKGITTGFVKSPNGKETQLRTKVNDGSGFASFHGLKTHTNLANHDAMVARSKAFVKAAFTDATKMNAIFRSQMVTAPTAGATCGADITAILSQSMTCMQGKVQSKAEQTACLAAAQNALSSAKTCKGVGSMSTVRARSLKVVRTCDDATNRALAQAKDLACNSLPSSCSNFAGGSGAMTSSFCVNIQLRQGEYQKCLDARLAVINQCFGGAATDQEHQDQVDTMRREVNSCQQVLAGSCAGSTAQQPTQASSSSSSSSSSSGSTSDDQAASDKKQDAEQDAADDKQADADAKQDAEQDAMDEAPSGAAQGSAATQLEAGQAATQSTGDDVQPGDASGAAGGENAPADSASSDATGADSSAPADATSGDSAPADAPTPSNDDSSFQTASDDASSQTSSGSVMGDDTSTLGADSSNGDVSPQNDTSEPATDNSQGATSYDNNDGSFQPSNDSPSEGSDTGSGDTGGGDSSGGGDISGGGSAGGEE